MKGLILIRDDGHFGKQCCSGDVPLGIHKDATRSHHSFIAKRVLLAGSYGAYTACKNAGGKETLGHLHRPRLDTKGNLANIRDEIVNS